MNCNSNIYNKTNKDMAEIIENTNGNHNYASNGKANAALTLG